MTRVGIQGLSFSEDLEARVSEGRLSLLKLPDPQKVKQVVPYSYINEESEERVLASIELEIPEDPNCPIKLKKNYDNEDTDFFTESIYEQRERPLGSYGNPIRGKNSQLSLHKSIFLRSNTGTRRELLGDYIFGDGTETREEDMYEVQHKWAPESLHGTLYKNHVDCNTHVRNLWKAFIRIGVPDVETSQSPITLFYEDDRGQQTQWHNHKAKNRPNLDALCTGITFGENYLMILYIYFCQEFVPLWSPWRYFHNSEILRASLIFAPTKNEDGHTVPMWQWCLSYDDIRSAMLNLFESFYRALSCGDSLTATPSKFNKTIGVCCIADVFGPDSLFQQNHQLSPDERRLYFQNSAKYTKDHRHCTKETSPSPFWLLDQKRQLGNDNDEDTRTHKDCIVNEIMRLDAERSQPPFGQSFIGSEPAVKYMKRKEELRLEEETKKVEKILPKLLEARAVKEKIDNHTKEALLNNPTLRSDISKEVLATCASTMEQQGLTIGDIKVDLTALKQTHHEEQTRLSLKINELVAANEEAKRLHEEHVRMYQEELRKIREAPPTTVAKPAGKSTVNLGKLTEFAAQRKKDGENMIVETFETSKNSTEVQQ